MDDFESLVAAELRLKPEETMLRGFWIDLGSSMTPDARWERINRLAEEFLELLATGRDDAREKLYRDPTDGRLWELTPVAPELAAGPPLLSVIEPAQALAKYGVIPG